ncbi:TIGR03809 family protein [Rhodoplanes roseus]|uniref:TIGR03809 family protein n=1 Tax=Rhodoplanes roseus TaxID=29409 RepID=A0A327L6X8_9BRAD|nr:TIGR03809 family protein [Rhodoplanes roseus]RAI46107.1 TIGR03809 family protein [Rhodoplanes roseus]
MPSMIPRAFSAATSRKGLMLAERRRAHLVELYKSGRWKRYFDEQEFLSRIREAVHEVELWTAATALWDEPEPPAQAVASPVPEFRIAVPDGVAPDGPPILPAPVGVLSEVAAAAQPAGPSASLS